MDMQPRLYAIVRMITDMMDDLELAAMNTCMQLRMDPRGRKGYDKAAVLFDANRNGIPWANDETCAIYAHIVNERLKS